MSRFEDLKASFKQRLLTAARKHLFAHLETTVSGYEKELDRKRKLLQMITKRRRAVHPADVQKGLVTKQTVCTGQQNSCLNQEDPEPGAGREDCGKSHSERNLPDPDKPSQTATNDKGSNFSEAESDGSDKVYREPDRKSFPCSVCGKRFRYKWYLVIHMRAHTGEKPYSCCVCGKRWTHKSRLNCHLKTHTHCSVCGKEFGQERNVSPHTGACSGLKPLSCCMGDSSQMHRRHTKKANSDGRWFSCSYCGKRFGLEKPLQVHMRVHSEEKLVCCSGCGKVFPRRESFHHMTCLRRKQLICCSVCNADFDSKMSLTEHMKFHAGETETDGEAEAARNSDPERLGGPGDNGRMFDFSESDTDDDPEPPHVKEEQEGPWSSGVPVKSEDDEEKLESSQLHHSQTENSRDSVRGSELVGNSDPNSDLEPGSEDRTSYSCDCDTEDSEFWKETREPQSNC